MADTPTSELPVLARLHIAGNRVQLHWYPDTLRGLRSMHDKVVEVREHKRKRSSQQNRRYHALLRVGALSLWGDDSQHDLLHEEIAQLLLSLPPDEKTGFRRRMRTPKLNTGEFNRYMDLVADKLIELGADLTGWDEEERKLERAE